MTVVTFGGHIFFKHALLMHLFYGFPRDLITKLNIKGHLNQ